MNIDKAIAIDLFVFNWTHGKDMLGHVDVFKCGKIFPSIEAPFAKKINNINEINSCVKTETFPLSVYGIPDSNSLSVNGSVSVLK